MSREGSMKRSAAEIMHRSFAAKNAAQDDKAGVSFALMQRPAGVTVISALFFLAAIYLWTIGCGEVARARGDLADERSAAHVWTGTRRTLHGDARRSRLCARRLGIIPAAQLGTLGRDARDGGCRRIARARRFRWRNSVFPCSGTDYRSRCARRSRGIWRRRPRSSTRSPKKQTNSSHGSLRIYTD